MSIRQNLVCGGDAVVFYAVAPGQAPLLRRQLREFSPSLPPGVGWQILEPKRP